jgi:hypothetical protein
VNATATLRGTGRQVSLGEIDAVNAVMLAVDAKGRAMDDKWGVGRLPMLVPADVAVRFASQRNKFSEAIQSWSVPEALKHGEAMERAYAKLDEIALASGASPTPPDQWEFETEEGLVVLVRDKRTIAQVDTSGRAAAIWSLDEIASVICAHPTLAKAKAHFPGSEVVSVRPKPIGEIPDDEIPF